MKQYDAVIIGFGKAGKTLAAELAAHDWSVAMVERSDKMYGMLIYGASLVIRMLQKPKI